MLTRATRHLNRVYFVSTTIAILFLIQNPAIGQQPSRAAINEAAMPVKLEYGKTVTLKASDLAKLSRQKVQVDDHGQQTTFSGVKLNQVLELAGVRMGRQRGESPERYLLIEATDNYRVVFALAEFDPDYTDKVALLVDQRDEKPLTEKEGPWRIVFPGEKIQARWIRQVKKMSILRPPPSEAK